MWLLEIFHLNSQRYPKIFGTSSCTDTNGMLLRCLGGFMQEDWSMCLRILTETVLLAWILVVIQYLCSEAWARLPAPCCWSLTRRVHTSSSALRALFPVLLKLFIISLKKLSANWCAAQSFSADIITWCECSYAHRQATRQLFKLIFLKKVIFFRQMDLVLIAK